MSIEKENYQIVKSQEEILRFTHFDNQDAWNLGKQIVEDAQKNNLSISVEIWINNYMVFRYGCQGMRLLYWMTK